MIGSSDSDSDDDKRVVRSAKDRRFDELKATCEEMRVRSSTDRTGSGGATCCCTLLSVLEMYYMVYAWEALPCHSLHFQHRRMQFLSERLCVCVCFAEQAQHQRLVLGPVFV
jgi:hypothetical protein